jgi:hypothetical protein
MIFKIQSIKRDNTAQSTGFSFYYEFEKQGEQER